MKFSVCGIPAMDKGTWSAGGWDRLNSSRSFVQTPSLSTRHHATYHVEQLELWDRS